MTRFIALGDFHNNEIKNQKWLYGFVLSPVELSSKTKIDYTVTEMPYSVDSSQYTANLLPAAMQYFYNTESNNRFNNDLPSKKRKYDDHTAHKQC